MTALEFRNNILPCYGAMLALAERLLHCREDACDTVQDVIRTLWERYETLNIPPQSNHAFVLRCVRNRCLDRLRRGHETVSLETTINGREISDNYFSMREEEDETAQRIEQLLSSIENLPDTRRSVMKMNLAGKSVSEIAEAMALTEANVRQILSRTRKKLREILVV